jgi:hypothetical protein
MRISTYSYFWFAMVTVTIIIVALHLITKDRLSSYKLLCISGVQYVNTETGVTQAYNEIGEIKNCKSPVMVVQYESK